MAMILVIDDEEQMARMVREMLESAGHRVMLASDGEDGLETLRACPVELVVTDILMPKRDGLETIRLAKRATPDLPIVAITGGGQTGRLDYLEEAAEFGAGATLRKPFGRAELLAAIDGLLARSGVDC